MAEVPNFGGVGPFLRGTARLATLPAYFRDVEACLQAGTERGLRYPRAVLQAALVNIRAAVAAAAEELPWFGPFRRCPAAVQPSVQPQAGRARALGVAEFWWDLPRDGGERVSLEDSFWVSSFSVASFLSCSTVNG